MAAVVDIKVDEASLQRAEGLLVGIKNGAGRAVSGAINDLLKEARTKVVRGVTSEITILAGRVRDAIKIRKATPSNLVGSLRADAKNRPGLMNFKAKDTGKRGVTYRIGKKQKRTRIPNAFIAKGRGGNLRVFARSTKRRLPLIDFKGPSINAVIRQNKVDETVASVMRAKLADRIQARVNLLLTRNSLSG